MAWLGILWVCLAVTLYRGARLGDDHVLHIRAPDFMAPKPWSPETEVAVSRASCSEPSRATAARCPAFFLVAYTLLRAALTRVTNDAHGCAGSVPRALIWGFLWGGLYTAPLAAFVALLHWAGHP